jgi:hypothetical protein
MRNAVQCSMPAILSLSSGLATETISFEKFRGVSAHSPIRVCFCCRPYFRYLDTPTPAEGLLPAIFRLFQMTSITVTSYGFGKGAVIILLSTFNKDIFSLKTTGLESSDSVFGFREMPGEGMEERLPIRSENNNSF